MLPTGTCNRWRWKPSRSWDVAPARVHFIVDHCRGPQLLEINMLPGFTDHSLLPKAAARAGITFDALVARLIDMTLARRF